MRKNVVLLLVVVFCLSLFGCSEKTYQLAWDGFCYTASDSSIELGTDDKEYIIDLLNSATWENDLSNCDCNFYFITQKQRIEYHSDCGIFNDTTNKKSHKVTEEQRLKINEILIVGDSEK